jgi:hypothetical protein
MTEVIEVMEEALRAQDEAAKHAMKTAERHLRRGRQLAVELRHLRESQHTGNPEMLTA